MSSIIIPLIYNMQSESQNGINNQDQRDEWSFDWWKTQHSNQGKFLEVGKFQNQNSDHHTLNLFRQEADLSEHWDQEQFNRKAQRKMQNKVSAKRARQKKKHQFEQINEKNKLLQMENKRLREEKFCKRCSRPLNSQEIQNIKYVTHNTEKLSKKTMGEQKQLVFQEIELNKKKQNSRGKLWIALGILMLILGLQMHGIFGNNEKYVRIPKSDINKWHKKFSESDDVGKFNFRMKTKGGEQMSMKDSKMRPQKEEGLFDRFSFQGQSEYEQQFEEEEQEKFSFDIDLLYAIEAQFELNGRYI